MYNFKKDFLVPYYIFEEIVEYVEGMANDDYEVDKWKNIECLLALAIINGRLTEEEAEHIKEKFCREK